MGVLSGVGMVEGECGVGGLVGWGGGVVVRGWGRTRIGVQRGGGGRGGVVGGAGVALAGRLGCGCSWDRRGWSGWVRSWVWGGRDRLSVAEWLGRWGVEGECAESGGGSVSGRYSVGSVFLLVRCARAPGCRAPVPELGARHIAPSSWNTSLLLKIPNLHTVLRPPTRTQPPPLRTEQHLRLLSKNTASPSLGP